MNPETKAEEIAANVARFVFSSRGDRTEVRLTKADLVKALQMALLQSCKTIERVRVSLERHTDAYGDAEPWDVAGALLAVQCFEDGKGF